MGQFGKRAGKSGALQSKHKDKKRPTLETQVRSDVHLDPVKYKGQYKKRGRDGSDEEDEEGYVDSKLSKKILEQAREQRSEIDEEMGTKQSRKKANNFGEGIEGGDEIELPPDSDDDGDFKEEDLEMSEADQRVLAMFMSQEAPQRKTLADMIMDKIREKEEGGGEQMLPEHTLDPKVVEVYNGVGSLLKTYRSGKLPKAFKVIPSLSNWEEILYLTSPSTWSCQAVFAGTRLFASNLNAKMAQRFYNLVLLPRVTEDIVENKKLNYHLYQSIKKALYKPAAFFKGFLLPLCEGGTCTLREAMIIGSALGKISIPVLHSSVAMMKIAEMDYSATNSFFLRVLFDKKYSLPYRVLDTLMSHFLRFSSEKRELPVLWHQALLTFIQRYKEEITIEEKEALKLLLRSQYHHEITPEIRRELFHSKSRGDAPDAPGYDPGDDDDDVMVL